MSPLFISNSTQENSSAYKEMRKHVVVNDIVPDQDI